MNERRWYVAILLVLGLFATGSASVNAQTTDPKTPASSPLWWTLSDEITPQELRRIYGDPKDSQRRYLQAVEKGLVEPVSPERLEGLVFFQHGGQSPELLPLWEAFDIFASGFGRRWNWEQRAPEALREHEVSSEGVETIVTYSLRYLEEVQRLIDQVKEGQQAFAEIQAKARKALGTDGLNRALDARDAATLSVAVGVPVPEVRRLMADWEVDPGAAASERVLPELRKTVSGEDWQRFRAYLLSEISPSSSSTWWKH